MSQFARKKITNEDLGQGLPIKANGHCVISNGSLPSTPLTPPDTPFDEADSPDFYRTHSFDEVLFDIRKVNPEKIAAQMTLIDLPLFKAIQMEEFRDCGWTKKDKFRLSPNIVAFTKKFNHTSFWVVQEILKEPNLRVRAEVVTQFIRIAKKLLDINNLHSLKAVVSALQSTPIYRLKQTWKLVHKKDKATYDRLQEFLSDSDNWKQLRDHMDAARLPCIPHLGMYLTDLSYLHSLSANAVTAKKTARQMETTFNMIAYCQNSTYDELTAETPIQKYLLHIRYIDELLKFFEDEQYKLSLKREPDMVQLRHTTRAKQGTLRTSKSHEDLLTPFSSGALESHSHSSLESSSSATKVWTPQPQHRPLGMRHTVGSSSDVQEASVRLSQVFDEVELNGDIQIRVDSSPEMYSVRRRSTLPSGGGSDWPLALPFGQSSSASASSLTSSKNARGPETAAAHLPPPTSRLAVGKSSAESPPTKWRRSHAKSHSLGTNVLAALGVGGSRGKASPASSKTASPELPHTVQNSRSLIDDSVLDDTFTTGTSFSGTPTGSLGNLSSSSGSSLEAGEGEEEGEAEDLIITVGELSSPIKEGTLKRRVTKRNGRSVSSLTRRKKHWVQLTDTSLLLYANRPSTRKANKIKVKGIPLATCRVKYKDPTEKMSDKAFLVLDDAGNQTKFSAKTPSLAQSWVDKIRLIINQEEERQRKEVEKSLIKL